MPRSRYCFNYSRKKYLYVPVRKPVPPLPTGRRPPRFGAARSAARTPAHGAARPLLWAVKAGLRKVQSRCTGETEPSPALVARRADVQEGATSDGPAPARWSPELEAGRGLRRDWVPHCRQGRHPHPH